MSGPNHKEYSESYAQILETLAKRIRSGEVLVTGVEQSRPFEKWYDKDKWEYFNLQDLTMTLHYYDVAGRAAEQQRKEEYRKANPKALEELAPYPIIALNGIPRGACNDYSIEEGWVQYLVPLSGNQSDYCVKDAPMEMRRYYGKVTIPGYGDPNIPWEDENNEARKIYESLLLENMSPFPTEKYEVIPWEKPRYLSGLRTIPAQILETISLSNRE
jgi:hypothetical protein